MQAESGGYLAANIGHFGRALRVAGLPVGTGRILGAVRAVSAAGFSRREDFYWTLHACFVSRAEYRSVFERAFALFWRDTKALEEALALLGAGLRIPQRSGPDPAGAARAAAAILGTTERRAPTAGATEFDVDARFSWSDAEQLRTKDFEQMTPEEERVARRVLETLRLPAPPVPARRFRRSSQGRRADWRATMRAMMAAGGSLGPPRFRESVSRPPALVSICDISGSMGCYSRMLLHFLHAVTNAAHADWGSTHSFVFGTRLTNVTRWLRMRDVDEALARIGGAAPDWDGGTRIGAALHAFNRDWSRRVLGQGAVVLLLTDGLDRGDAGILAREARRLRLSARSVIWLNPLLRWEEFAPKARGVAALLPHVDTFCGAHSVDSLAALTGFLSAPAAGGEKSRMMAMLQGGESNRRQDPRLA